MHNIIIYNYNIMNRRSCWNFCYIAFALVAFHVRKLTSYPLPCDKESWKEKGTERDTWIYIFYIYAMLYFPCISKSATTTFLRQLLSFSIQITRLRESSLIFCLLSCLYFSREKERRGLKIKVADGGINVFASTSHNGRQYRFLTFTSL